MNRKLADKSREPASVLPEVIEEFLDYGTAICCAFNRFGTLLATGTTDGYVGIWDFETRGLAKVLPDASAGSPPDTCAVTSLCWSHNGRYLLAGQTDKRVILWDVLEGKQLHEVLLPTGVQVVSLSASKPFTAVVSLHSGSPVVVELSDTPVLTTLDTGIDLKAVIPPGGPTKPRGGGEALPPVALLSSTGAEVFVALQQANKGFLLVYDLANKQLLDVYKLPAAVLSMSLASKGNLLLLTCSDKVLRLADVQQRPADAKPVSKEEAEAKLSTLGPSALGSLILGEPRSLISLCPITYQNGMEKGTWLKTAISHDGQHVVGAISSSSFQRMYIWDRAVGKLKCILEGPSGAGMADMAWHPCRPLLVTVTGGSEGHVYIWAPVYNENWSAFAPDFKELEENKEYVEAEDEFDIHQPAPSPQQRNGAAASVEAAGDADGDDVEVNIITREPLLLFGEAEDDTAAAAAADDADEQPLLFLPAEVEVAPDKEVTDQQQSSGDASDDDAAPEASGRAGGGGSAAAAAAGADSDGGVTDQPQRERKRKVRFESEELDDAAFGDLLERQQREELKQLQAAKGKGGKHGLPPLPASGRGQGGSRGSGGGSGSALNPADADAAGAYAPQQTALLGAGSSSKSMLEHQLQLQRQHMQQHQQD